MRSLKTAKNIVIVLATQLLTWGLSAAVMVYLPRYFGDVGLGRVTVAMSVVSLIWVFVSLGSARVLTKDIARQPERVKDYVTASLLMNGAFGVAAALVAALVVNVLHYPRQTCIFTYITAGYFIFVGMWSGLGFILSGQERFAQQSAATLTEKVIGAVWIIGLIFLRAPMWLIAAAGLFSNLAALLMLLRAFRGVGLPLPSRAHLALIRHFVVAGMPFFTAAIFATLYGQVDPIILQHLDGDASVGWYALVKRLFGTALFIPTTVTAVMLPQLSRAYHDDREAFFGMVRRMNTLMVLCAAPIAIVLIVAPARLIKLLHYPPGFLHAVPVFVLFGFGLILWFLSQSVATALIACDREKVFARATASAAAMLIPLCCLLVWLTKRWLDNGAIGAGLADISVEVYLVCYYIRALPAGVFSRESVGLLGKAALASVPMGLIVLALGAHIGLFSLLPGLLTYGALCYCLRVLSQSDLSLLRQIVTRKAAVAE